ncbi:hypothetical protein Adt_44761 [Abeliophyllum distichum]|uniref:Uncharacterized protein n=1 Tax=Abeliophyllum distichum TaxID=126358 RepID=A0ABD1PBS5_9LAMI
MVGPRRQMTMRSRVVQWWVASGSGGRSPYGEGETQRTVVRKKHSTRMVREKHRAERAEMKQHADRGDSGWMVELGHQNFGGKPWRKRESSLVMGVWVGRGRFLICTDSFLPL